MMSTRSVDKVIDDRMKELDRLHFKLGVVQAEIESLKRLRAEMEKGPAGAQLANAAYNVAASMFRLSHERENGTED